MQLNTDLTGLFGVTLAIVALLVRLPRAQAMPLRRKAGLTAAAIIVLSIPLWGVSAAGYVRGMTGDLSVPTLILLSLSLLRSMSGYTLVEPSNRHGTLKAIAIAAILFYPLALGFTMFDPYRLGYSNLWFTMALLGLAVWASVRYSILLALCIALAVAAWSIGWYESPNLWDYLLDPWLALYAFAAQIKYRIARRRKEAHA